MMITLRNNMFFLVMCTLLFGLAMSQNQSGCMYVYGNWMACVDSVQNRTISCACGGAVTTMTRCTSTLALPDPLERDCQVQDDTSVCFWKWTVWSQCTSDCGGGNSSRLHQCLCDGIVADNELCEPTYYLGSEVVPCNYFKCGETPALNKQYWIEQDEEGHWPMKNGVFNCSVANNLADSPKGKTYSYVLVQNPQSHLNPEWYYLAREYIASLLNIANGAEFTPQAISLVNAVGVLLENCAGWNANEIPLIYSSKEKLGRLNNNIGGLENVDDQVATLAGGRKSNSGQDMGRLTFLLIITVPAVAVLIVVIIIGATIYYIREKKTVAQDEFESEDEEEPLQNNPNNTVSLDALPNTATFGDPQVPLELVPHGESTSEEQ